jgi:N-acetylglutamate synthase-like GNAT family acetyltransferase
MARSQDSPTATAPFSEKGFYLSEFRGRTLALAMPAGELLAPGPLESVLKELEANATRVVLISSDASPLRDLLGTEVVPGDPREPGLEGAVWRTLARVPRAGLVVAPVDAFAPVCRHIAVRLGLAKLVWIDAEGGLPDAVGGRASFVDRAELSARLAGADPTSPRSALLREIESALDGGVAAVNLCTHEGLADELFTYAGSGTLFTRERYVRVRRLGLDDYDAAQDLIARGVSEGYLAARSPAEIDHVLAHAFGAFVEDRYLAGIGALLFHDAARAAEIASLYTLTRFLGEGVGGHLVGYGIERARELGCRYVFACTTHERVAAFFERNAFRRARPDEVPEEKWRHYDPARRARVHCLRCDIDA